MEMNSMAIQKINTSATMTPNKNQARTFFLGIFSLVAAEIKFIFRIYI